MDRTRRRKSKGRKAPVTHLTHPGLIIKDAIAERSITPYRLAKDSGLSQSAVTMLVNANRAITAETALRIGKYLNVSPQMLINLQTHYDLSIKEKDIKKDLGKIVPIEMVA